MAVWLPTNPEMHEEINKPIFLVSSPRSGTSILTWLLDFLGAPYIAKCVELLAQRINSSNVPDDFKADDSATDPAVVEEATRLGRYLGATAQPTKASHAAANEMEAGFAQRTHYMATLESRYQRVRQKRPETRQPKARKAPVSRTPLDDPTRSISKA